MIQSFQIIFLGTVHLYSWFMTSFRAACFAISNSDQNQGIQWPEQRYSSAAHRPRTVNLSWKEQSWLNKWIFLTFSIFLTCPVVFALQGRRTIFLMHLFHVGDTEKAVYTPKSRKLCDILYEGRSKITGDMKTLRAVYKCFDKSYLYGRVSR